MKIMAEPFGTLSDGREVYSYTLESDQIRVEILNYGAVIRSLFVPDREGKLADVVLGCQSLEQYQENNAYFGAVIGRNCNRIAGSALTLFDRRIELASNDGSNNLHSGPNGLSHRLFSCEMHSFNNLPALLLSHTVEDESDGFPGNLIVTIAYALTEDNALMIDYRAVSDKDTVINLTNHSYFNLSGHDAGTIYNHELELQSAFYTPVGSDLIPTGEILGVAGTPFDFQSSKKLGQDIDHLSEQLRICGGYDHNFVLSDSGYRPVARVHDPNSGRVMTVITDLPGMQLYTSNSLSPDLPGKNGATYQRHGGVCLETQFFPNAVNTPWFPSPIFSSGEEYTSTTTYQFSIR